MLSRQGSSAEVSLEGSDQLPLTSSISRRRLRDGIRTHLLWSQGGNCWTLRSFEYEIPRAVTLHCMTNCIGQKLHLWQTTGGNIPPVVFVHGRCVIFWNHWFSIYFNIGNKGQEIQHCLLFFAFLQLHDRCVLKAICAWYMVEHTTAVHILHNQYNRS